VAPSGFQSLLGILKSSYHCLSTWGG